MDIVRQGKTSALLLLASEIFLLAFFPPSLILAPTVTAGGDTPSHFISAIAMQGNLLSCFSPVAWIFGNYAGFPLFLNYFPLPFAMMAFLSLLIPLTIAFKFVTLLAIFPLPLAVFYCLRRLGFTEQVPALGAIFSVQFLFMTENSMWGGNICSTLAGEFSFGIAFILAVCLTGKLYRDAAAHKSLIVNAFLEGLIAMGSGYPLLQAGAGTSFFLIRKGCIRYIFCMHAISFALIGFWILPFLFRLPWDTSYSYAWLFLSWTEILPPILWPAAAGALFALIAHVRTLPGNLKGLCSSLRSDSGSPPELYLWWQFGTALLGFCFAPALGLVDIRFLPFAQITLLMLGAIGWGSIIKRLPCPNAWMVGFAAVLLVITTTKGETVDAWVRWNYSGMESKPLSNSFAAVNAFLHGSANSPRVVYEHSDMHSATGTTRAFEMLPLCSGRSTLEGLYMQSSVSSPFVFYIQSELSQSPSSPFELYYYSRPDPERAARHLALFNVSQVVAVSDNTSNALDYSSAYELQATFPPFRVYRLTAPPNSYVEPVRFQPRRISHHHWKEIQYEWFRKSSLKVPLIVAPDKAGGEFLKSIPPLTGSPEDIPEIPILDPARDTVSADAVLEHNRITITTNKPGHPLWIKVSYSPDWKITSGEGELYLASPAFMLLVPKSSTVVLSFDAQSGVYLFGKLLSLLALALCAALALRNYRRNLRADSRPPARHEPARSSALLPANARFFILASMLAVTVLIAIQTRSCRDPVLLYNLARTTYEQSREIPGHLPSGHRDTGGGLEQERLLRRASALFEQCMSAFPDSSIFDHCLYYKIKILAEKGNWGAARTILEDFLRTHPDTRIYADCLLALGTAHLNAGDGSGAEDYLRRAAVSWPETSASRQACRRLAELLGSDPVLARATEYFASGQYLPAYSLLRSLSLLDDAKIRNESTIALAWCCLRLNRWEEASNLFTQWLSANFDSPQSQEAQQALRQCQTIIAQEKAWQAGPGDGSIRDFRRSSAFLFSGRPY